MLRLQAEESLYELFSWPDGDFKLIDGQLPPHKTVAIALNVLELLLEGMQRLDEGEKMREHIPSVDAIPVVLREPLDDPALPVSERTVLATVDDQRSIEEICLEAHSSEYLVCRVLPRTCLDGNLAFVRPRVIHATPTLQTTSASALFEAALGHLNGGRLNPPPDA